MARDIATDETDTLISADKVEGTDVYNPAHEKLGTVKSLMIDKRSGKVAYAVMSFGGFLGIGDEYHPLPWQTLDYDTEQGGFVVDLDKESLEGAPRVRLDKDVDWEDRRWNEQVHEYYKVPPYWV